MDRIFCLLGNIIKLYEFALSYADSENKLQKHYDIDMPNIEVTQAMLEQQGATDFEVVELDTSTVNWLEGIDIGECNMEKAVEIWQMGEVAYRQKLAFEEASRNGQLRADIDYVMLMGGL